MRAARARLRLFAQLSLLGRCIQLHTVCVVQRANEADRPSQAGVMSLTARLCFGQSARVRIYVAVFWSCVFLGEPNASHSQRCQKSRHDPTPLTPPLNGTSGPSSDFSSTAHAFLFFFGCSKANAHLRRALSTPGRRRELRRKVCKGRAGALPAARV